MLTSIISSSARIKILNLFMINPENRYYIRQIAKITDLYIQAVQRETARLYKAGLLLREKDGNRIYFKTNKDFFLFNEIKNIIIKTTGVGQTISKCIKNKKDILFSFIYGSYAKNKESTESDIDIFVVGNISSRKLIEITSNLQDNLGREINPYIITVSELRNKLQKKEHFVSSVIKEPKIFIKGSSDEFRIFIKSIKD